MRKIIASVDSLMAQKPSPAEPHQHGIMFNEIGPFFFSYSPLVTMWKMKNNRSDIKMTTTQTYSTPSSNRSAAVLFNDPRFTYKMQARQETRCLLYFSFEVGASPFFNMD